MTDFLLSASGSAVGVVVGALVAYWINVRQRRQTKREDIVHDAIAAVSVAEASFSYARSGGATSADKRRAADAREEAQLAYTRAERDARAAIGRARAYDDALAMFLPGSGEYDPELIYRRAAEIIAQLRRMIERRVR